MLDDITHTEREDLRHEAVVCYNNSYDAPLNLEQLQYVGRGIEAALEAAVDFIHDRDAVWRDEILGLEIAIHDLNEEI